MTLRRRYSGAVNFPTTPKHSRAALASIWQRWTGSQVAPEQVEQLFRGTATSVVTGPIMAVALCMPFIGHVPAAHLLGWLAAVVSVRALRLVLNACYRSSQRAPGLPRPPAYWMKWLMALLLLQSLTWGLGSLVLWAPQNLSADLALHLGLSMVPLTNLMRLAMATPMVVTYTLGVMVPLVLRDLWIGELHNMLALIGVLTTAYILLTGRQHAHWHQQSLAQRRDNARLIEALQAEAAISAQARREVEMTHAAKLRFFAAASHDLRQPLHALGLYAQALRLQGTPREVRAVSGRVVDCVDGMASMVDDMLELSSLDMGSVQVRPSAVPLAGLLEEAAAQHRPAALAKGLALDVQLHDAASAQVLADRPLVLRVLANLLSNAVRYTPTGWVRVHTELEPGTAPCGVWVHVQDSGVGIEPGELDRVFEEFYQVGNAGRDRRQGHGLGLAIVKRLSDLMGLRLQARSQPGQGSQFSVFLRLARTGQAELAVVQDVSAVSPARQVFADAGAADPLWGKRVLLLEDDLAAGHAMVLLLTHWGCEVTAFATAAQALGTVAALPRGHAPEFVVADLRLAGGMDGCQAALQLRQLLSADLPVVLVSGDVASDCFRDAIAAGFTVMRKPVKPAQLRAFMNAALADQE